MALAADRNTPRLEGDIYSFPVKASTTIYAGALVCLDANGFLVPGAEAATLTAVGRADEHIDNSAGADGDLACRVRQGVFRWNNSESTDEIGPEDVGAPCYVVDDETVALTDDDSARSAAGTIMQVDAQGVWVKPTTA